MVASNSAFNRVRKFRAGKAPSTKYLMPKILTFSDYFLPGYKGGGPITSLRNAAMRLSPGHEIGIVTRDRDLGDDAPYKNVRTGCWTQIDGISVLYLSPSELTPLRIAALLGQERCDVLYLNSFHSVRFTMYPLLARLWSAPSKPTVLAPRGEFAPAALAMKPWRKMLYKRSLSSAGLLSRVIFQASSDAEASNIRSALGPKTPIHVAPDLTRLTNAMHGTRPAKQTGVAKLTFLGRISPMKNIAWLIGELGLLNDRVELSIYGPIEDPSYWRECEAQIGKAPEWLHISYGGQVNPSLVPEILSRTDALVLPSLGENFAQVVAEALSSGCPVLASDRTPWPQIQANGAGWWLPIEQAQLWRDAVQTLARMPESSHVRLRDRARQLALSLEKDPDTLSANRQLFERALAKADFE